MDYPSTFLRTILTRSTSNTLIQLFRYGIVGCIAFVVDFGMLAFFTEVTGLSYLLSGCIGFTGGVTINYFLSVNWVFETQNSDSTSKSAEFLLFVLIGIIGLGINALIMWMLTEYAAVHYLISKLISTIIVFIWNFIARRALVYKFAYLWKRLTAQTNRQL